MNELSIFKKRETLFYTPITQSPEKKSPEKQVQHFPLIGKNVPIKGFPHNSRYGSEDSVRRMSAADQRQIPAPGH